MLERTSRIPVESPNSAQDFETIFEQNFEYVGRIVSLISPFSTVDDVRQEAFIAAAADDKYLPELGDYRKWLGGIARNKALNDARRLARRFNHELPFSDLRTVGGVQIKNYESDDMQKNEIETKSNPIKIKKEIHSALAGLPFEQAEVVLLVFFGGKTLDSAAEALGIPKGTARSRLRLAREKLRENPNLRDLLRS